MISIKGRDWESENFRVFYKGIKTETNNQKYEVKSDIVAKETFFKSSKHNSYNALKSHKDVNKEK